MISSIELKGEYTLQLKATKRYSLLFTKGGRFESRCYMSYYLVQKALFSILVYYSIAFLCKFENYRPINRFARVYKREISFALAHIISNKKRMHLEMKISAFYEVHRDHAITFTMFI